MGAIFAASIRSGYDGAPPAGATIIQGLTGDHSAYPLLASLASLDLTGMAGKIVVLKADLSGFQLVDQL